MNGGQTIEADAPYQRMPLYVKAVLSFGLARNCNTQAKSRLIISLLVYTGSDATFDLYEDDGLTYSYEKGAFSAIPIRYDESAKTLTIGRREGSFHGMIAKRTFSVVWVGKNKPVAFNADRKTTTMLFYHG